jgi:hypothetical protein
MFKIGFGIGARIGVGIGGTTDGYAPVPPGPGLVFMAGSSNAQGPGVAASMTDFPGIGDAYAGFQFIRMGSTLAGAGGGEWVTESIDDLQDRVTTLGAPYVAGTCGWECKMGQDLDAANPNAWGGATFTTDGAMLHTTKEFLNPAWPTVGAQWVARLFTAIDAAIVAHGKPLKVFVWGHGNDANDGTSAAAYYANLIVLFDRIRQRYGDIGIVIERITNRNTAGSVVLVRMAMEAFAMRPENGRVAVVYTDECAMRDTAHYADDAGGVLGYCEVGKRMATACIAAANDTVHDLASPWWGAQGVIQVAGSIAFANPIPLPVYFGSVNNKRDIGVLWYCANSNNAITAPTGWTQVTGSPVWDNASALNARLHVFTRVLQPGDTAPTIADVASDDGKCAGIAVIRNSSGLDVNPTTATVADAAASADVSFPSITPVTAGCLIVHILAHGIDAAVPQLGALSNAGLTSLSKHVDFDTAQSLGYGCVIGAGVRATADATGATTGTLLAANTQALMTLAFRP